jgi:hypothetical protein
MAKKNAEDVIDAIEASLNGSTKKTGEFRKIKGSSVNTG